VQVGDDKLTRVPFFGAVRSGAGSACHDWSIRRYDKYSKINI
jgi:hypothetical protein